VNDEMGGNIESLPSMSNMRDFVLTITPKLKFEFHRDYTKATKELKGLYQSFKLLGDSEKLEKKRLLEYFPVIPGASKSRLEKQEKGQRKKKN
jgi:hypothetical protein